MVEPESAPFMEVKLEANGGGLWGVEGSRERAEYEVVLREGRRLVLRSGFEVTEVAALVKILEAR